MLTHPTDPTMPLPFFSAWAPCREGIGMRRATAACAGRLLGVRNKTY